MMFLNLPDSALDCLDWPWSGYEPYYQNLAERTIDENSVDAWLADWSHITELFFEVYQRLYVAITANTADKRTEQRYNAFLDGVYPAVMEAEQQLKEKLLASGLEPVGFFIPLRNLRAEASLFCQANLSFLAQELKLSSEYDRVIGAQTITWEGKELTITQLAPVFQEQDRERREQAWRLAAERQLSDRQEINELWSRFMEVRREIARNAGEPDYRAYRWKQLLRFDYSPQDSEHFHQAIERVMVPAARRIYEKRRCKLDVPVLRPWDLDVDPLGRPPLRPFERIDQLEDGVHAIYKHIDATLGDYFEVMRNERLLDLENRKDKAPGGYCTEFPLIRRPFIFMNSVGLHSDVLTLLHEGGHAFHVFETARLPYFQQKQVGMEFAEVASMSMELLAYPYLTRQFGGFYSPSEAARACIEQLNEIICFWPYMAVVDAFQHWVYMNHSAASNPANCDARWGELWDQYMTGIDWSGLENERVTGWQRKLHIHQNPFYYIEYGLAQLGAIQVWRNAQLDQPAAVAAYRKALAMGGTETLPQLYAVAGAKLAFDAQTLQEALDQIETTIEQLERI
jgi:oligoendopeptidase F